MRRAVLIAVCACLLLAGCKVDTTVSVRVNRDGSGVVRLRVALDADAVQNAEAGGGKLEDRVRVGDLKNSGWTVSPWQRAQDGSAALALSKRFVRADELAGLFAELNGRNGPVHGVELTRHRGLLFTTYRLRGVADLTKLTTGIANDPQLVASLTAQQVNVGQIDLRLTQELRDAFRLRIRVTLPDDSVKEFAPRPGRQLSLSTSSSSFDRGRALLLLAALLMLLLAIVLLLRPRRRISPT